MYSPCLQIKKAAEKPQPVIMYALIFCKGS